MDNDDDDDDDGGTVSGEVTSDGEERFLFNWL
jgi:hypothetical protein